MAQEVSHDALSTPAPNTHSSSTSNDRLSMPRSNPAPSSAGSIAEAPERFARCAASGRRSVGAGGAAGGCSTMPRGAFDAP